MHHIIPLRAVSLAALAHLFLSLLSIAPAQASPIEYPDKENTILWSSRVLQADSGTAGVWITAILLEVKTSNVDDAGTDDTITATFMRRGVPIFQMELARAGYDDLERNTTYDYYETDIPRRVDRTPDNGAAPGEAVTNSRHPNRGLEYSYGLTNELSIVLETDGDDMWVKDSIALYTKQSYRVRNGFDEWEWVQDIDWTLQGIWDQDTPMSSDKDEGWKTVRLIMN